jgi:hypothetical protein
MQLQPHSHSGKFVIERRNADGSLDLQGEQPPSWTIQGVSLDDIYHKLFWQDPANEDKSGTPENLYAWLKEKGWAIRPKTW